MTLVSWFRVEKTQPLAQSRGRKPIKPSRRRRGCFVVFTRRERNNERLCSAPPRRRRAEEEASLFRVSMMLCANGTINMMASQANQNEKRKQQLR